jgi:CubicO group peptidase (beta-lactamase class C family)
MMISIQAQSLKHNIVANERFEHIRKIINDKIEKGEIPSLSIAVAENDKIIWMESFGYADKENNIKATPNTLYSIASISKPLTATGIMKLNEMGKIDLDADVLTYIAPLNLKYYVNNGSKVTCRNLLNHTGGLPMYFNYYYDDTLNIPPMENVIKKYGIVVYPPSTKYSYANLGYGMLGYIISKVTKRDFNEFMTEEIFKPLGMPQTTVDISSQTKSKLARRYDGNGKLLPFSFSDTPGAGNFSTTVNDLIHFGLFHLGNYNNTVLKSSTIHLMQQKQYLDTLSSDEIYNKYFNRNNCGLGWFINEKDYKYKVVYHAGGMDGAEGMLKLVPEKSLAVAALVNKSTADAALTNQITDSVLISLVSDLKDIKEKNMKNETKEIQKTKVTEQKDLVGKWKGNIVTYNQKIPIELIFQEDGDIHIYTKAQFNTGRLSNENVLNRYEQHKMLLDKWFFDNGYFMGAYPLNIPGEHLIRCADSKTMLNLQYESGKIKGIAAALASSNRMYYGISYYLELEKEK